jgi:sulfur-carrier protein
MFNINIHYFALLREKAGVEQELFTTNASNLMELYHEVSGKYNFGLPHSMIQVAVNDEFNSFETSLENNMKVVFIPPVAGG